jgi:hypothetical protein
VNVAHDDQRAIRMACAFSPWRWDFWGFVVPDPIAHEESSGAMNELALSGPLTRISADD